MNSYISNLNRIEFIVTSACTQDGANIALKAGIRAQASI